MVLHEDVSLDALLRDRPASRAVATAALEAWPEHEKFLLRSFRQRSPALQDVSAASLRETEAALKPLEEPGRALTFLRSALAEGGRSKRRWPLRSACRRASRRGRSDRLRVGPLDGDLSLPFAIWRF